jgi:hypothetical protein
LHFNKESKGGWVCWLIEQMHNHFDFALHGAHSGQQAGTAAFVHRSVFQDQWLVCCLQTMVHVHQLQLLPEHNAHMSWLACLT